MSIENRDLLVLANRLNLHFMDHPWKPGSPSAVNRVIHGIVELEKAGMDWIAAVKSDRFMEGRETVGRILAYPEEAGMNSEPRRLLRMLGIDGDGVADEHALLCGIAFSGIGDEDVIRSVWEVAADIALDICALQPHEQAAA